MSSVAVTLAVNADIDAHCWMQHLLWKECWWCQTESQRQSSNL